jgi:superfamily II DNA or RNA helicase
MVYVAHRGELLQQTLGTLRRERPDRSAGLERAACHADLHDRTVVASIQSLCRPDRLARYRPEEWPLMVVDEAHRAVAESYLIVLHHFRFLSQNGQPPRQDGLLLGTTATSRRTDEIGLGHTFALPAQRDLRLEIAPTLWGTMRSASGRWMRPHASWPSSATSRPRSAGPTARCSGALASA